MASSSFSAEIDCPSCVQLEEIINSAPIGIARVAGNGRWLSVNASLCEILGYTEEQLLDLTFQDLTHPDDLDADLGLLEKTLVGDIDGYRMEKRYFHKSGRLVWGQLSVSLVRYDNGEPNYFVAVIEDITLRKENELALDDQAHFIQRAMNASLTGIYIYNVVTGINDYINQTYTELTGYTLDDIHAMSADQFAELFHQDERQAVFDHMREVIESDEGLALEIEYRFRPKNGEWVWFLSRDAAFERDQEGKVSKFLGSFIDITARKKLELQLRYDSDHDHLTGAFNRQAFITQLRSEFDRSQRYQRPLSLLLLDLDHFKDINDHYGHDMGDQVLVEFVQVVQAAVRGSDVVARYGGEEFVIILPESSLASAQEFAERLCQAIAQYEFVPDMSQGLAVTASIGVATYPEHADTYDALVKFADDAMYAAKNMGRNQVHSA